MKEILRKISTIFILVIMLINNSLLSLISIAVEEIEEVAKEQKINFIQEINLEKYVNYTVENNIGVLLQFDLKVGIEHNLEDKDLKSIKTYLNISKIDDEYPKYVEVIGKAKNGSDSIQNFEYTYEKENGILTIEEENKYENEYIVICYYSENCYNSENKERNLEIKGKIQANIIHDII